MIWFHSALMALLFGFGLWTNEEDSMMSALYSAIDVFILLLFLTGLRSENQWAAVLFAVYCSYDLLSAMARGLNPGNAFNLFDAVLSFVAICGVFIWFRERKALHQSSRV